MKVMTVFGSPRKKGNTATVVGWMEEALQEAGHQVERVHVATRKLNGCISCFKCQLSDEFTCVQKDDGNELYGQLQAADAILMASPLYWWGFTSQIKPVIDRFMCQVKGLPPDQKSGLQGKAMGLVLTCWGPEENNTESAVDVYTRTAAYLLVDNKGQLIVPGCAPTEKPSEEAHKERAREFALKLVG